MYYCIYCGYPLQQQPFPAYQEHIVSPGATGGISLQRAITDAAPGTTIRLSPGDYHLSAPIVITHSLRLVGGGYE